MTPSRWRQGSYRAKELWALGGPAGSRQLATVLGNAAVRSKDECDGKPVIVERHVCQHLSLADLGKAYAGKPRSEPDPGKPAVRDHEARVSLCRPHS
jgi:alkylated DNA repair dioxygenase AlkB